MRATHGHLWHLPDGTGLHAPFGDLTVEESTGRLCCHLCGRWYTSLGSHVRAHGYTAQAYRAAMGLCLREPLITATLSTAIRSRQANRYHRDDYLCEAFAHGAALPRRPRALTARNDAEPVQRVARRRAALQAGRETIAARRAQTRRDRLARLGHATLGDYLRVAYVAGASLESLAAVTGLGRARLRAALDEAGITVRPTGINTASGRRSRAVTAERIAAERVGTDDLHGWLRERCAAGWSLVRLAAAVGHSTHWVRWRLNTPGGATAEQVG